LSKIWFSVGMCFLIAVSILPFVATPVSAAGSSTDVIGQINAIRVQNGLAALVEQPQLSASAQAYALAMATGKFFGHVAPSGTTMVSRDEAAGYSNWSYIEENIAAGQTTVTDVVNAWMKSPSHRENILSPKVTETGVGYVYVAGTPYLHYWVQEFGSRVTPAVRAAPTKPPTKAVATSTTAAPPTVAVATPTVAAPPTIAVATPTVSAPTATAVTVIRPTPKVLPTPIALLTPSTVTISAVTLSPEPPSVYARTQRDPDNLNLFLILYQGLGID
jgi:hypothetical protein